MKAPTKQTKNQVRILSEILEEVHKGNVSAFAAELSEKMGKKGAVSRQRLKYMLELESSGRGDRLYSFVEILCAARKIKGENWAVFGSRLERYSTPPRKPKPGSK
jgi:hypothetical protein